MLDKKGRKRITSIFIFIVLIASFFGSAEITTSTSVSCKLTWSQPNQNGAGIRNVGDQANVHISISGLDPYAEFHIKNTNLENPNVVIQKQYKADVNGNYEFYDQTIIPNSYTPGNYKVEVLELLPISPYPIFGIVPCSPGFKILGKKAVIAGKVWYDENGDSQKDGFVKYVGNNCNGLVLNHDVILSGKETRSTKLNKCNDGPFYEFEVDVDNWQVSLNPPEGWKLISPNPVQVSKSNLEDGIEHVWFGIQKISICGNGIRDSFEQCDGVAGVGQHQRCTNECNLTFLTYCGDGIKQNVNDEGVSEQCDRNDGILSGQICTSDCRIQTSQICGNGKKEGIEQCDGNDGVGQNQQCTSQCTLINLPFCGDGIKNGNEQCDKNDGISQHQKCEDDCELKNLSYCGDGIKQNVNDEGVNEQCDRNDGISQNQRCTADCKIINLHFCGDGIKNNNEECDKNDGVGQNQQCSSDCKLINLPFCGDNVKNGNEECDGTSGVSQHQKCTNECKIKQLTFCGDNVKQSPNDEDVNEQCDGLSGVGEHQSCTNDCKLINVPFCGDGVKNQPSEQCDKNDGVGEHQKCTNECKLISLTYCGDNVKQSPNDEKKGGPLNDGFESCDDGNQLSIDQCTVLCTLTFCGDKIIQKPNGLSQVEECDDGNAIDGDGCTHKCKLEKCGDGIKDSSEECDDGNGINTDQCTNVCTLTFCGDSVIQKPNGLNLVEECDDGNVLDNDGCDQKCKIEIVPVCGDGIKNGNEQCDKNDGISQHQKCGNDCKIINLSYCGDGIKQSVNDEGVSEQCDGTSGVGNNQQCTNDCKLIDLAFCGDGIKNGNEQCDGTSGVGPNQACSSDCKLIDLAFCGNGKKEGTEQCDGNDGVGQNQQCTSQCTLINLPFCGDGIKNGNEQCDGNDGISQHQKCGNDCKIINLSYCGDNVKQSPNDEKTGGPSNNGFESCDDGNQAENDQCTIQCTLTFCGDKTVQKPNGLFQVEECDDGNAIDGDGCTHKCKLEKCGDGIKDSSEECDDGNGINTDQCTNVCTLTFCGDSVIQKPNGLNLVEECDDGNVLDNDGCDQKCKIEKGPQCNPIAAPITIFSDGLTSRTVEFSGNGGSDSGSKVTIPRNLNISSARVNITGIAVDLIIEKELDIVVVNDVSGSMDDNCGRDRKAQPGETPCKINDLKNATSNFIKFILKNQNNTIGLVSYNNKVVDSLELTNDKTGLLNVVNNYQAKGTTCISCGLVKGVDISKKGKDGLRDIVLMSDGKANTCISGSCSSSKAKKEAIEQAIKAFNENGIRVHTIAFGEDADIETMKKIAEAGHGKFKFSSEKDIEQVFLELATEITTIYPQNPTMDVGKNGKLEFIFNGAYKDNKKVTFTDEAAKLISTCNCPGCLLNQNSCVVDFILSSDSAGKLKLHNLLIDGCIVQ